MKYLVLLVAAFLAVALLLGLVTAIALLFLSAASLFACAALMIAYYRLRYWKAPHAIPI